MSAQNELPLESSGPVLSPEEQIYRAYPKKVGKPVALRAIRKALKTNAFDYLLAKTQAYAKIRGTESLEYVPNPSTWFNQERFNDDPATWRPRGAPVIRGDREKIDVPIHQA